MNGHSMGSKQEALGAVVQQESYGTVATREMWWDDSMAGVPSGCFHLLRRDRQGGRGGGVALYIRGVS